MIMFVLLQIERNLLMTRPQSASWESSSSRRWNHEETRSSDGDGIKMKTTEDVARRRRRRDGQETVTVVALSRDHPAAATAPNQNTLTHTQHNRRMVKEGMDTNANIVLVSLFRQESNIRQQ